MTLIVKVACSSDKSVSIYKVTQCHNENMKLTLLQKHPCTIYCVVPIPDNAQQLHLTKTHLTQDYQTFCSLLNTPPPFLPMN